MKISDFFERVYVVNLPSRKDRRQEMIRELEEFGMPLKRNKVEIFPALRPDNAGNFPSIGVLGCFLSHLAILKQAQKDKLANVLVMEDDLTISKQLKMHEDTLVEQLCQTNWDFVFFGHRVEEPNEASLVTLQPFAEPIITAHFYGVNGKVLDSLISFLEQLQQRPGGHPDGGPMHLDGAYSTFRSQNPNVVTLIASPNLGWQRSSRSDIYPNKWFDHVPIFNQLVSGLRKVKKG